ncbi:ketopantoate reductase family protein [Sporosarcina newyorkensis]|uniref:2-dehydropantoate 2-reductase n=1 Tax=Sporosarcina newyorkensis TaxID=759851 RepID=A0A1T4Y7Z5_9BACL|nr:ketopantoate reductase family protein [Sporosarcina newyorkensis]SKA97952.1 2-dehydropantoate 2-reductase [Sporosarcina newyorkensis]
MKIVVVGAGAMGSRFGSALFTSGHDVTLVDSWIEHVDKINKNGLSVTDERGTRLIPITSVLPEEFSGRADLLLMFTKSMQTETMIKKCLHMIAKETEIVTLQNGIGNLEMLSKYISKDQLFAGTTTYASNLTEAGSVHAYGSGMIEMMHINGNRKEDAERIVTLLNAAGLVAKLSDDVMRSIWEKAAFNAVLNPLCTLTSSPVGTIGSYESIMEIIEGILEEIELISRAEGVSLDKRNVLSVIEGVFHPDMSAHHFSSMYHDIQRGRGTEIDYLNGAFIRKAHKHGISAPINTMIFHLIKIIENRFQMNDNISVQQV